ncbi:hypothetical protein PIROE2DRAFT_16572, partial [Piromyces sp. E2]
CVLSQKVGRVFRPIGYYSRSLNSRERNYSVTDKELLGIVCGIYFLMLNQSCYRNEKRDGRILSRRPDYDNSEDMKEEYIIYPKIFICFSLNHENFNSKILGMINLDHFKYEDSQLFFKNLTVVPKFCISDVLLRNHDIPIAGHMETLAI